MTEHDPGHVLPARSTRAAPEVCPSCGAGVEHDAQYCVRCGADLRAGAEGVGAEPSRPSGSRRALSRIGLALLALGLAVALSFAVYFDRELASTRDAKAAAEARLTHTLQQLHDTRTSLRKALELSARRKAVLTQADKVLSRMEPVLSSVDGMRDTTEEMTATQESFAANAGDVVESLGYLIDYTAGTNPYYWDRSYLEFLVSQIESAAGSADADYSYFKSLEDRYANASASFETKATRYVRAVEQLRRQLQAVVR